MVLSIESKYSISRDHLLVSSIAQLKRFRISNNEVDLSKRPLPPKSTPKVKPTIQRGALLYTQVGCIGCHSIPGYKASFPTVYSVPMIAGQSEKFIANALIAYRKGDRNHPTMKGIAGSLTDQDIADLAAYFSNLE